MKQPVTATASVHLHAVRLASRVKRRVQGWDGGRHVYSGRVSLDQSNLIYPMPLKSRDDLIDQCKHDLEIDNTSDRDRVVQGTNPLEPAYSALFRCAVASHHDMSGRP